MVALVERDADDVRDARDAAAVASSTSLAAATPRAEMSKQTHYTSTKMLGSFPDEVGSSWKFHLNKVSR